MLSAFADYLEPVKASSSASAALSVAATGFVVYGIYRSLLPKPIPGVPYDKASANTILGDLPALLRESNGDVVGWTMERARKFGQPLCQVFILPLGQPALVLSDFRESQDILLRRTKEWDRTDWTIAVAGGVLPHMQFNMKQGLEWKSHRKLVHDLMSPDFLHNVAAPNIWTSAQTLLDLWEEKARLANGRPFSAMDDMCHAALDAVLAFSFGDSYPHRALVTQLQTIKELGDGSVSDSDVTSQSNFAKFKDAQLHETLVATLRVSIEIGFALQSISPAMSWFFQEFSSTSRRLGKVRNAYVEDEITKAVERRKLREDHGADYSSELKSAVDLMVDRETKIAEKDGREPAYWSPTMKEEISGFVLAGHDTTSTTLSWGLKLLADHPEVQRKLRKALFSAHESAKAEGRMPSAREIDMVSIPYLLAVIEEILRVGGAAPLLDRQCNQDSTVLGCPVPKGTTVLMLGKGPSFTEPGYKIDEKTRSQTCQEAGKDKKGLNEWQPDDMDRFDPERWLGEEDGKTVFDPAAGPTLPFGLGLRGCFGKKLAYVELKIIVTLLFWKFEEFLKCPDELSSYAGEDGLVHKPTMCYVRLKPTSSR